jgi:RNA polymerase sigma-70 factor, ECF subfamily
MNLEGRTSVLSVSGDGLGESLEQDDIAFVRRCQKGDARAFEQLVIKYRSKVFSMIYGMVQNEQDAWDLAQEGFIKAWRSIHRFKGQASFYTWLYRIVTNVAIDSLRRKGFKKTAEFDDQIAATQIEPGSKTMPQPDPTPHQGLEREEIRQRIEQAIDSLRRKGFKKTAEFDDQIAATQIEPGSKTMPQPDPTPHQGLEREEIRQRIEQAIDKLSPEHRAVIVMKEIEELQYNEIAEVLGCSIGTVMSRLFYARKKLQTLLKDVYENL